MKFLSFSQTELGISLPLPAHGWVGAMATSLLAVYFAFPLRNQIEASPTTYPNAWRAEHCRKILFSLKEKKSGARKMKRAKSIFLWCVELVEQWRRERDSNPRGACTPSGFQDRRLQPLGHLSVFVGSRRALAISRLRFAQKGQSHILR